MKKILTFILILFVAMGFIACNKGDNGGNDDNNDDNQKNQISYYETKLSENRNYNTSLYFLNTLEFQIADPSVIYVNEGEEAGYFYAYGTSDDIRVYGFQSWRSKDMSNWESMGVAYKPDFNVTWADVNYWAPEVIYDAEDQLYYLFYSAQTRGTGIFQMSVAYSDKPQGPFISANMVINADGKMLQESEPVYNLTSSNREIDPNIVRLNAIDISPFIDPVTGKKYLYFSYFDSFTRSEIFGMEMKDWFTPDYSTLKQLTAVGYLTVDGYYNNDLDQRTPEGTINEGPFMTYHEGTYYLTLSVYGYTDEKYQVRQALSDNPLGTFTKYLPEDGGAVIATDPMWTYMTSAGHHCFVYIGDETYIAYHTFLNRSDVTDGRALAFDKIEYVDFKGVKLMHANGPSNSPQPLPKNISGYENITKYAHIKATNHSSDTKLLNDGIIPYLTYQGLEEFVADEGTTTITLTFDDFVTARSIMVYNSFDYYNSFINIEKINLHYQKEAGKTEVVTLENLEFDWNWNVDTNFEQMNPGGAVIAEFNDLSINKIEITIRSVQDSQLGISEIIVLGKTTDVGFGISLDNYTFTNPPKVSPEIITEGTTIGSNQGLKTNFGYDLTHDDGTEDAYIIQNWPYDQYAYFNNVYSTNFYVEAEFTITNNRSYANDKYPKFGLTVSTVENTIFFFVDANPTYTQDAVGTAQRTLDNRDWDWNATEQNVGGVGISYRDGQYVKLAIIRKGAEFYMLADDKLYIYYDKFNVFTADYKAVPGFLTFNTEMKVKNYFATTDSTLIDEKIELHSANLSGETMGMSQGFKTTSGWDLSTDDGTPDAYMETKSKGDQYTYFKDFYGDYFYVETQITVIEHLGDPYPKFGIALRSKNDTFFYFIDGNPTYTSNSVGYVNSTGDGWDWPNWGIFPDQDITYKDGQYVTLGLLRDKDQIYLFVNGILIHSGNISNLDESELTVVGFLSFSTGIRIKGYFVIDDPAIVETYKP